MCGIAGILSKENTGNIHQVIHRMTTRLAHRGPDDEGYVFLDNKKILVAGGSDTSPISWQSSRNYAPRFHVLDDTCANASLAMGHRRLSIIDLTDGGHQPICSGHENQYWMVCNGEIYNYIEIKKQMAGMGIQFTSASDMEVLLKAYIESGTRCLGMFNGMWAFVIYDPVRHILFGARDRLGVKPLYYVLNNHHFAFASEHKALLEVPSLKAEVNEKAIFPHLAYGLVEKETEGFFRNIFELHPSHFFIYNLTDNRLHLERYYTLAVTPGNTGFEPADFHEAKDEVFRLTENAIRLRMRSDIPVGFCLSGGLDSSTIVTLASQMNNHEHFSQLSLGIKAFTAANRSDSDESQWASVIARHAGVEWFRDEVTSETLASDLDDIIYYQDIPLYSTSTYAQNRVMRLARNNNISILLDGQGGDELFAGYQHFYTAWFGQLLGSFNIRRLLKELNSLGNSPTNAKSIMGSVLKLTADKTFGSRLKKELSLATKNEFSLFNSQFLKENRLQIQFSGELTMKSLNEALGDYCTNYYLKNLLRWEDRCSMQYSIESRTPFSDDIHLIEYLFSLPGSYKIHNGWSKYILREAIKGIVPDAIRLRTDKKGFSVPQTQWLMETSAALKNKFLSLKDLDHISAVNKVKLEKEWDTIFSSPLHFRKMDLIFRYICYLIWLKTFFTGHYQHYFKK